MLNKINQLIQDKQEYKEQMARVKKLPEDYRFVFAKIQSYMWTFAGGDGNAMLKKQYELIELFEESARENKHVLDITGDDVASFCDEFISDTDKWTDRYRKKLNNALQNEAARHN